MNFKRKRDYYAKNEYIFDNSEITINPGVTVLVGCNGAGKTTTLKVIKSFLKENKINYMDFDGVHQDNQYNAIEKALYYEDIETAAYFFQGSEGQNIILSYGQFLKKLRAYVKNNDNDLFILIDSVDSGLDISNIIQIKDLFKIILKDAGDKNAYIIVSTNNYEFVVDEDCLDVKTGKHVSFENYEQYKNFILEKASS